MIKIDLKRTVSVVAAVALLASCSDWTETESLKIKYPDLRTDNPALYERYTQSLRDYRGSDHKVMIGKFDNKPTAPAGQAEHLNALPDSIDYVILMNPDNLGDEIQNEMAEVRSEKGMKVMYEISYADIISDYKTYVERWNAEHPETTPAEGEEPAPTDPADTLVAQNPFVMDAVAAQLEYFSEYAYDGLNVSFTSINPLSVKDEDKPALLEDQEAFLGGIREWRRDNPDALFFYEGAPQYLLGEDVSLIEGTDYIIIPAESQQNVYGFSYLVNQTLRFGNIPSDRFVIGVTTVSLTDPGDTKGTFIDKDDNGALLTAITGAAYWATQKTSEFSKAGICVSNVQNDYFNIQFVYPNVRKAISIMNPSPLN